MNSLKTIDNRHLIPRWQKLSDAINSGDLVNCSKKNMRDIPQENESFINTIEHAKCDWLIEKNLFTAIEFLEKQKLVGMDYDEEAYSFVRNAIKHNEQLPSAIKKFFCDDFEYERNYIEPQHSIRSIRKQTILHPEDAYLWIEMARNYLTLGIIEKCEKALTIARSISPNDRYISRSMMRFYHHTDNVDKALYYVRKMRNYTHDPMLLSGEIALSNLTEKSSHNIKLAKNMLQSQNYSAKNLSELASEIATMEIMGGNERKGKNLLVQSLNSPTENAVAQTTWINQCVIKLPWIDEINNISVPNNYEGKIYLELASKDRQINWEYLFEQCILWNKYQPFSREPIYFGGSIAADFMENFQTAFDFSIQSLTNHKNEAGLLNNIAYSAILNGDQNRSKIFLDQQLLKSKTDEEKVVYLATKGLYEFRFGEIIKGKESYIESFELANNINLTLFVKVLVYYYRELNRINEVKEAKIIKQMIMKYKDSVSDYILIQLMKKFEIID